MNIAVDLGRKATKQTNKQPMQLNLKTLSRAFHMTKFNRLWNFLRNNGS